MSVAVTALANGFRVISHHMPHLETTSLGVWVGAGARSESVAQHGISHLLEHMAFKGTARRTARKIAEEIESVGGDLNAATSLETTAYYARVMKADLALAVDIIADIVRDPRFDAAELEREQDVILQEIAAAEDSPDDVAHDLAQEAAFPDQVLGRPILGTPDSVRSFRANDLTDYMRAHYSPASMVLAAAGAVDHAQLARLADEAFGDMPACDVPAPEPARYFGGYRRSNRPFEQTHIVLCFEGPSYRTDTMYTGQILSSMLGGGMSSRLFQEARETRGLCYSIYSYCWGLSDSGLFGIHAATGAGQVTELFDVMCNEFQRLADQPVQDAELDRAKAQLKSGLLMSLESSSSRAEQIARQTLAFGAPREVDELVAKVDAVDKQAVRTLAGEIILSSRPSISAVGTLRDETAFETQVLGHSLRPARAAE
jgi:predicted Zn-dependent peptidase